MYSNFISVVAPSLIRRASNSSVSTTTSITQSLLRQSFLSDEQKAAVKAKNAQATELEVITSEVDGMQVTISYAGYSRIKRPSHITKTSNTREARDPSLASSGTTSSIADTVQPRDDNQPLPEDSKVGIRWWSTHGYGLRLDNDIHGVFNRKFYDIEASKRCYKVYSSKNGQTTSFVRHLQSYQGMTQKVYQRFLELVNLSSSSEESELGEKECNQLFYLSLVSRILA